MTLPAISAATVTPWTATAEPVAVILVSQFCSWAVVAVTVSAGMTMAAPAAPMAANCISLVPTSAPTTTTMMRVVMENFLSMLVGEN